MEFVQVVGFFPWCRNHGKLGRVISQRSGLMFRLCKLCAFWNVRKVDGTMPGMVSGMMRGMVPGVMPGMVPGVMPGMLPGVMHGMMSGMVQTQRSNLAAVGFLRVLQVLEYVQVLGVLARCESYGILGHRFRRPARRSNRSPSPTPGRRREAGDCRLSKLSEFFQVVDVPEILSASYCGGLACASCGLIV